MRTLLSWLFTIYGNIMAKSAAELLPDNHWLSRPGHRRRAGILRIFVLGGFIDTMLIMLCIFPLIWLNGLFPSLLPNHETISYLLGCISITMILSWFIFFFGATFQCGFVTAIDEPVERLLRLISIDIDTLLRMNKESVSAAVNTKLRLLANELVDIQRRSIDEPLNWDAERKRQEFREAHGFFLNLGLVGEDWGQFFPKQNGSHS